MTDRNTLKSLLRENTTTLVDLIENYPPNVWNKRPGEGKWSPGEIAEHILLTDQVIQRLFHGPSVIATDRIPLSKEKLIKEVFLDHSLQLKAFGPIVPTRGDKDKQTLINGLQETRTALIDYLTSSTTSELCMGFSHGKFGLLTKFEWIYFIIYHTQRHQSQMQYP